MWLDRNGNGIQEFTESGLNGIPVQLFNEQGILLGLRAPRLIQILDRMVGMNLHR